MNEVILQAANALGAASAYLAGSKRIIAWPIGLIGEAAWATWALLLHHYGILPWSVAWSAVFARNWIKWAARPSPDQD